MQTDPIADFLTRIRNAAAAKHQSVDVPVSKLKTEIARIHTRAEDEIESAGKHALMEVRHAAARMASSQSAVGWRQLANGMRNLQGLMATLIRKQFDRGAIARHQQTGPVGGDFAPKLVVGPFFDERAFRAIALDQSLNFELAERLPNLTVDQVNAAVRKHLKTEGIKVAIVARDAAALGELQREV